MAGATGVFIDVIFPFSPGRKVGCTEEIQAGGCACHRDLVAASASQWNGVAKNVVATPFFPTFDRVAHATTPRSVGIVDVGGHLELEVRPSKPHGYTEVL